ncbi:hypothetical protein [Dyadobacter aurulentus]|uniref:hypothetical protein n=1 Tax=Dyadobacter sp. UC 10 TaxID=2605428 RepID=UPI001CED4ECD|nr:hypothetical protein [Dyadobacter sp. UC 10]
MEHGSEQRRYIEANPQFKSVTVYDANMHKIHNRQSQQLSQSNANIQQQRNGQELVGDDEKDHHSGKKTKKTKGISISQ